MIIHRQWSCNYAVCDEHVCSLYNTICVMLVVYTALQNKRETVLFTSYYTTALGASRPPQCWTPDKRKTLFIVNVMWCLKVDWARTLASFLSLLYHAVITHKQKSKLNLFFNSQAYIYVSTVKWEWNKVHNIPSVSSPKVCRPLPTMQIITPQRLSTQNSPVFSCTAAKKKKKRDFF